MHTKLKNKITSREAVVGVIGMGFIGLYSLDVFAEAGFSLVGYDIDKKKIRMLKQGKSYLSNISLKNLHERIKEGRFTPSSDPSSLKKADVILISVPVPIDEHGTPNLELIKMAFQTVFDNLKKDQLIILESSVPPKMTERVLLPLLEKSGLKVGVDFFLAYAPEMYDIGNKVYTRFTQVPKITSGVTPACLKMVNHFYINVGNKIVPCSSTKIAESSKLLQNAYRLVNISFVNEMKVMFDSLGIDIWEVITAASSKPYGFTPFYPSAGAGGDCIPVAPAYLIWTAKLNGGHTKLLEMSEQINGATSEYVVHKTIQGLAKNKKSVNGSNILVLGVCYKKDTSDTRHSPALKIISILKDMRANVKYHDPLIKKIVLDTTHENLELKSVRLTYEHLPKYDAVVIITPHSTYNWSEIIKHSNLLIDTCNVTGNFKKAKEKIVKA